MSPRPYPLRYVICEVCHQQCSSERKDRDICRDCYRNESQLCCVRCGTMRHAVEEATGLCPRCANRPQAVCSRCSKHMTIYNQELQLCKTCNLTVRKRNQTRVRRIKRPCSTCGEVRSSALMHRSICRACWMLESKGQQICARCQKPKVIHFEQKQLCKQCYKDYGAKKALQRYLTTYTTLYPYNKELFDLLVTTINWEMVTQRTNKRFRTFGQFLQAHKLHAPLTWESIEEALPPLGATHRNQPKYIRACLLDIGHHLAEQGTLEKREYYIARRNALSPFKNAPQCLQPVLQRYITWLWERKTASSAIRSHLELLILFWSWCDQRGIHTLGEIHTALINEYLLTLYWHWQCTQCQMLQPFEPHEKRAPQRCPSCSALGSFIQIPRYIQNTVASHRASLWLFFKWAKVNKLVVVNPVQRRVARPEPKIQHYSREVIEQLCTYILDPHADPMEAFTLYLIIFHGLSVWELQHAEIPTMLPLHETVSHPTLDEMYYVILPRPTPSKGDHTPGRPSTRIDFAFDVAPWLKPLLKRFEHQRFQILQNTRNRYMLVSPGGTKRRNTPVGKVFVWTLVQRASLRVLGTACNPSTLRKTAGVILLMLLEAQFYVGWDGKLAKHLHIPGFHESRFIPKTLAVLSK